MVTKKINYSSKLYLFMKAIKKNNFSTRAANKTNSKEYSFLFLFYSKNILVFLPPTKQLIYPFYRLDTTNFRNITLVHLHFTV